MLPLCPAPQQCVPMHVHTHKHAHACISIRATHACSHAHDTLTCRRAPLERAQVGIVIASVPWHSGGGEASGIWVSPVIELSSHVPPFGTLRQRLCCSACPAASHETPPATHHTTPGSEVPRRRGSSKVTCPRSHGEGMETRSEEAIRKGSGYLAGPWGCPGRDEVPGAGHHTVHVPH